MTTTYVTADNSGAGFRITLNGNQGVVIDNGVTVGSTNLAAIWAGGNNSWMDIYGTVHGEEGGISLLHADNAIIHVWESGSVGGSAPDSFGVVFNDSNGHLENHGVIYGDNAVYALLPVDAVVENFGEIRAEGTAIFIHATATGSFTLANDGVVSSGYSVDEAYVSNGDVTDRIFNSGTINGTIALGKGDDVYQGADAHAMTEGSYALGASGLKICSNVSGGGGNDEMVGGTFNDFFLGGSGNDRIRGGGGHDYISGDTGSDSLSGGAGSDFFVFATVNDSHGKARDSIADFRHADGDLIDLFFIDARAGVGGNQDFDFIGSKGFSGKSGELRYDHAQGETWIFGNTDSDGKAEFTLQLNGHVTLSAGDFSL